MMITLAFATVGCEKKTGPPPAQEAPAAGSSSTDVAPKPAAAHAGHEAPKPSAEPAKQPTATRPAIAQKTCPVMGGDIDPEIYVDHAGRRVYFCCEPCKDKFKADPAKYLAKLNEQLSAATKSAS